MSVELPAAAALEPDFIDHVTEGFRLAAPMMHFVNDALDLPF